MTATTTTTSDQRARRPATKNSAIPDRLIGVYFALFPIAVAMFLSVQAVRAQDFDGPIAIPAHHAVPAVAP